MGEPVIGHSEPSHVHADIQFALGNYDDAIAAEWDGIRPDDTLFLLSFKATDVPTADQGNLVHKVRKQFGLKYIRGCQVKGWIGSDGNLLPEGIFQQSAIVDRATGTLSTSRSIRVKLDPIQYQSDISRSKKQEPVHETFNILLRRPTQENNFSSVLKVVRELMQQQVMIPDWLQDVFLGYGDRFGASHWNMPDPELTVDFRDTFVDIEHVKESFPDLVKLTL